MLKYLGHCYNPEIDNCMVLFNNFSKVSKGISLSARYCIHTSICTNTKAMMAYSYNSTENITSVPEILYYNGNFRKDQVKTS